MVNNLRLFLYDIRMSKIEESFKGELLGIEPHIFQSAC